MKKIANKPTRKTSRKKTHKQTRILHRALRFLPAILLLALSFTIQSVPVSGSPKYSHIKNVLSYATSVSNGDLLASTNSERTQQGIGALSLNSQLNSAAQAKANDMVARNYWSHTTPTGEEPWVFIQNAGYGYKTAGENLAYGFDTSADTITGWMNSPPHRDNLLNSAFVDVGFGYANSLNYVDNGEQTIVVAMYGAPMTQAAPAATVPVAAAPTPKPAVQKSQSTPASEPLQSAPAPEPVAVEETKASETAKPDVPATVSISPPVPVASAVQVSRIQVLTGGNARWSSTLLVLSLCAVVVLWLLQRGTEVKRLLRSGEHFLLHNIHMDFTVAAFLVLGFTLIQTSGTIR